MNNDWQLEKQEWLEAMQSVLEREGESGAREIFGALQNYILDKNVSLNEATLNTPYRNTIPPADEPVYPGNIQLEEKIEKILLWNAAAMVVQAADSGSGVGGHIATYASASTMMEVGFNHLFRAPSADYGGDIVIVQPHASPGVYARALLEQRLSATRLENFRRQLAPGGGLCSYPHPRAMPDFWQVPCASMGLSTPVAIYQARFAKYLENRGLKNRNGGKVWCFIGDGESDEPEVLGTINIAAREHLDNLILVVNCNLQRLDGPVRGNGKIIQELERSFRGADWNVIKVIWSSGWDPLLARDHKGLLQKRMEEASDGDYQYLSVSSGDQQREIWVENNPELQALMNTLTDDEVKDIKRGGQDKKKVYAAYHKAVHSARKPSVILIKTVKGWGMGRGQGQNTSHQKKQLDLEERRLLAQQCDIPLERDSIDRAAFYLPPADSPEVQYLLERRRALNGFLPRRQVDCPALPVPDMAVFAEQLAGSGERKLSTTMSMVRILAKLLRHDQIGRYIVPIVPDEARTFGLDSLFQYAEMYSPEGQKYTPVDGNSLLPYKEAADGQILQEGICETGAIASFMAAGTAYAIHGIPTIPFYLFYSIFGFQRVGDMIWACGDMLCRGFLLGGTAGRTTLNGEGLQHQDGHSPVIANTVPNLLSYDPAFAYELALIVRQGIRRMYAQQENVFYYLTLYNENYAMPKMADLALSADELEQGILRGMYAYSRAQSAPAQQGARVHLLGSGAIFQQVLAAAELLQARGIAVDIWSVTSFNELYRDAEACRRWNWLHPQQPPRQSYVAALLQHETGVFVAVSDYMKALANSIGPWIPGPYIVLGTDGYGLSESRAALRDYFEISAEYIALAGMQGLSRQGLLAPQLVMQAMAEFGIDAEKIDPARQ